MHTETYTTTMKKMWIGGLALLIIAGIAGLVHSTTVARTPTFVSIETSSPYVVTSGSYPQFGDIPSYENERIAHVLLDALYEHEHISEENWTARFETQTDNTVGETPSRDERYLFSSETTITQNDDRILSFVVRYGGYSGGAHGYEHIFTYTYDKQKKREITIYDLYSQEELESISRDVITSLTSQLAESAQVSIRDIDQSWVTSGAAANETNYARFTLSGSQITFYFEQYQVAPYAFGERIITRVR